MLSDKALPIGWKYLSYQQNKGEFMIEKLILLSVLVIVVSSCGYEKEKPEPPKSKLTKEQIQKQEYEQRLEDYDVQFLFECNGVKVYRFLDCGTGVYVYFTDANGITEYQKNMVVGKFGHAIHRVQSINIRK